MAKPPAGSSLLFGALADSGRIKQRKNGSYRMVLKGVDEIDWFTDRPDRVAGEWSPKKLVNKWDGLFGGVEPNAQATFEIGGKRELVTFEMFKPKLRDSNQKLSFKIDGIGEKNKDLLTGLKNKRLSDASLFIDDGKDKNFAIIDPFVEGEITPTTPTTVTMKVWNYSDTTMYQMEMGSNAVIGEPTNNTAGASLYEGKIYFNGGLTEAITTSFEVPVTLNSGTEPPLSDIIIAETDAIFQGETLNNNPQCSPASYANNGPKTVYYSFDDGNTQSIEATCENGMQKPVNTVH